MRIAIRRLDPELPLPQAQHDDDAGIDLYAREDGVIEPAGGRAVIPTGIAIAIPPGYGGFVQPRSGLAARHGVTVMNSPGLIDAGYRNEVNVALINTDPAEKFEYRRGDRIAQLVIQRVERVEWEVVEALDDDSTRGLDGWGSTGRT